MGRVVCASAPGKVILFGEHAVVYGEPAVAAALTDLRIFCRLEQKEDHVVRVCMQDLEVPIDFRVPSSSIISSLKGLSEPPTEEDSMMIQTLVTEASPALDDQSVAALVPALYLVRRLAPMQLLESGIELSFRSKDLPVGAGLGSSAAMGVACSAALVQYHHSIVVLPQPPRPELLTKINQYAFYSEILLHGTPSGIDNAVSAHGGAIYFSKDLKVSPPRTTVEHFDMNLQLSLVYTHVPRSTRKLVADVRSFYNSQTEIVQHLLSGMGSIATQFYRNHDKLQGSMSDDLLQMIQANQCMLKAVGVSHPSLDTICRIVEEACPGMGSAKLTGAGGGGCAIVLWKPGSTDMQRDALHKKLCRQSSPFKFKCFSSAVGGNGVLFVRPSDFPEESPDSSNAFRVIGVLAALAAAGLFWAIGSRSARTSR